MTTDLQGHSEKSVEHVNAFKLQSRRITLQRKVDGLLCQISKGTQS